MKYLFFDIECANNFKYNSTICSFGYTLTDEAFNVIKCEDLVMNPESTFKEYLLQEGSDCTLAYTEEYFLKQPNFKYFYPKIQKLLTDKNNIICGFSVENDINYLYSNCRRYKKDFLHFNGFDIQLLLKEKYEKQLNLQKAMDNLKIDYSSFQSHKSSDDSYMTMLVFKAFCEQNNISPKDVVNRRDFNISLNDVIYKEKIRRFREFYENKIKKLMDKPTRQAQKNIYMPMISKKYDFEQVYNLLNYLHENGAVITRDESKNPIRIYPDDRPFPEEPPLPLLEMKHVNDILPPEFQGNFPLENQRKKIPNIDARIAEIENSSKNKVRSSFDEKTAVYEEKICPNPVSHKLDGKKYRITFSRRDNLDEAIKVYKDIYENGGFIAKVKGPDCIFIKSNGEICPEWIKDNDMGITFQNVHDLYETLGLKEPEV